MDIEKKRNRDETLPEFSLELVPNSEEAKHLEKFEDAGEEVGNRGKIGGIPDFIQGEYFPTCPLCKKNMIFYAQLDAIGPDFRIGDCGLIYIFICPRCYKTKTFVQSY